MLSNNTNAGDSPREKKPFCVKFYVDGYNLVRHLYRLGIHLECPVIAIDQTTGEEVERYDGGKQ